MARYGSIFAVFLFLDGFFHSAFPGAPLKFCRSALMSPVTFEASQFHSAGKAVHFECVFVCVSVRSIMIHLFVLELVSQFLILLHSAAYLFWM